MANKTPNLPMISKPSGQKEGQLQTRLDDMTKKMSELLEMEKQGVVIDLEVKNLLKEEINAVSSTLKDKVPEVVKRVGSEISSKQRVMWSEVSKSFKNVSVEYQKRLMSPLEDALKPLTGVFSLMFKTFGFLKGKIGGVKETLQEKYSRMSMEFNKTVAEHVEDVKRILSGQTAAMYDIDEENYKRQLREKKEEKGNWFKTMAFIVALGALIGGLVRKLLLPFELVAKVTGIFALLSKFKVGDSLTLFQRTILSVMKQFQKFGSGTSKFSKMLVSGMKTVFEVTRTGLDIFFRITNQVKGLTELLGKIGKFGKLIITKFSAFSAGIKLGFKYLGWPLQIIMSLISFVTGFIKTKGTLWDKIRGGLRSALLEFIEMPVKLLAWLAEKALGLFGFDVKLVDKVVGGVRWVVDKILDVVFFPINMIQKLLGNNKDVADDAKESMGFFDMIGKFFKFIVDSFHGFSGFSALKTILASAGTFRGVFFGPFSLILSVYDFFYGFFARGKGMKLVDRLKMGMSEAIIGFFVGPIKLMGWLFESVMGLFGFEAKGMARKFYDDSVLMFKNIIDIIFYPIEAMANNMSDIWDSVKNLFSGEGTIWSRIEKLLWNLNPLNWLIKLVTGAVDLLSNMFDLDGMRQKAFGWILDKVPSSLRWMLPDSLVAEAKPIEKGSVITSSVGDIGMIEELRNRSDKKKEERAEELSKQVIQSNNATSNVINTVKESFDNMVNIVNKPEKRHIPVVPENVAIVFKNFVSVAP